MSINDLFHININATVNVTPGFSHGAMTQAQQLDHVFSRIPYSLRDWYARAQLPVADTRDVLENCPLRRRTRVIFG